VSHRSGHDRGCDTDGSHCGQTRRNGPAADGSEPGRSRHVVPPTAREYGEFFSLLAGTGDRSLHMILDNVATS
jgi:hypothetical protein